MKIDQKKIDKIYKILKWSVGVSGIGGLAVLLLLPKGAVGNWAVWTWLGFFFASMVLASIIKHWATDEEKEEFKQAVKEAMLQAKAEENAKPRRTIYSEAEIKSPLKGLTPEQSSVVVKLLQKISVTDKGYIRNSELMAVVRALNADNNLDDSHLDEVVRWIEYVTENKVDAAHFKSEYNYRPSEKNITKMGDLIRREFDKLR